MDYFKRQGHVHPEAFFKFRLNIAVFCKSLREQGNNVSVQRSGSRAELYVWKRREVNVKETQAQGVQTLQGLSNEQMCWHLVPHLFHSFCKTPVDLLKVFTSFFSPLPFKVFCYFSSLCKHVNKRLTQLLTAHPMVNTWELNQPQEEQRDNARNTGRLVRDTVTPTAL